MSYTVTLSDFNTINTGTVVYFESLSLISLLATIKLKDEQVVSPVVN